MIEPGHPDLSVVRQCELVSISRSSFYYQPVGETAETLALMRRIDAQFGSAIEIRFSRTFRAVISVSCGVGDAGTEKLKSGSAIHGPLQHLEPVDLAFGRACRPGQVEGCLHGGEVAA